MSIADVANRNDTKYDFGKSWELREISMIWLNVKSTWIVQEQDGRIVNFVIWDCHRANTEVVQIRVNKERWTEKGRDDDHDQDDDTGPEIDVLWSRTIVDEVDHEDDGDGVEEGRELGEELVEGAHGRRADQGGVTPVEDEDQVLHDVRQEEEADQDVGHGRGPLQRIRFHILDQK